MGNGQLVVVSAPSGTGKTSLDTILARRNSNSIEIVRSCTTRIARKKTKQDENYQYLSRAKFTQMIDNNEFVEWAEVFDNYYGTSKKEVEMILKQNKIALLEIDVQGCKQIKKKFPSSISIFILPPCLTELHRRLIERDTDHHEVQQRRINAAYKEIEAGRDYDNFVVNDDFDKSYNDLENIILNNAPSRLNRQQGINMCNVLLAEFEQSNWMGAHQFQIK